VGRGNLTITVARKPLAEGSVAKNALKWGTGGLNIDESRIGTADSLNGGAYSAGGRAPLPGDERQGSAAGMFVEGGGRLPGQYQQPSGRWPSNVILVHFAGCRKAGTKQVPGHTGYPNGPGGKSMHYSDQESRGQDVRPNAWAGHADEDGLETVDDWVCAEGCPVAELDRQAGPRSQGHYPAARPEGSAFCGPAGHSGQEGLAESYLTPGGVARFFKQSQSESESDEDPE